MIETRMKEIEKAWGKEIIIADEPEYCGKILVINKGAGSSWHRHPKKETFFCLKGKIVLRVQKYLFHRIPYRQTLLMTPTSESVNIAPREWHQFHGVENSEIMEVSTHDDPTLVERRSQSYSGESK